MDEPAVRTISTVTHYVHEVAGEAAADAVLDHEQRMHLPPRRRGRATAIPFASITMDDSQVCRAWELMKKGASLEEAAAAFDVPDLVLIRCLHAYQPAWRQYLGELSSGD